MNQVTTSTTAATFPKYIRDFRKEVDEKEKNIEKLFSFFFFYSLLIFPGIHLKHRIGKQNAIKKELVVEWYVFSKTLISIITLWNLEAMSPWLRTLMIWVLAAFTIETLFNNLLFILANKLFAPPRSFKRVVILSFLNYLEIIFNFSYFYAACELVRSTQENGTMNTVDYLFFSISTGGILGYGDYMLYSNEGKILAMIQGLLLLMFFGLFVSYNISLFSSK